MTVDNTDFLEHQASVEEKRIEQDKLDEVLNAYMILLDHGINVQLKFTNLPPRDETRVYEG